MRYKVGDRVRVRNDLERDRRYGGVTCVPRMTSSCGNVYTIVQIFDDSYHLSGGNENCTNYDGYWFWSDEMLEPYGTQVLVKRISGLLKKAEMVKPEYRDRYVELLKAVKSIAEEEE